MTFKRNSVAAALANESGMGRDTPLTPPRCEDCTHFRIFVEGRGFKRPEDGGLTLPGTRACYDADNDRGINADEVRADEDACGPDGGWFVQKIQLSSLYR